MLDEMPSFKQRIIVGSVTTLITLLKIILSPIPAFKPLLIAIFATTIGIATWELYQIALAKGLKPAQTLGITFGVIYVITVGLSTQYDVFHTLPEITLLLAFIASCLYYFINPFPAFTNLSATVFSLFYLAVPLSCMIRVIYFFGETDLQDGRWWLFYLIAVSKMTDTGGFFIGKKYGRQQLAPYISPNKTWEGAVGGLLLSILTSMAIALIGSLFTGTFSITLWESIWLGGTIGLLAQCGDLVESLLKRDGGIKDSNHLPGLGGMLDIVDSMVFTSPLVYIFLKTYY